MGIFETPSLWEKMDEKVDLAGKLQKMAIFRQNRKNETKKLILAFGQFFTKSVRTDYRGGQKQVFSVTGFSVILR